MSASKRITAHLGKNKVRFEVVEHRKVFTAYDLAQTLGTKLDDIAKTLLVHVELPELKKKEKKHFVLVVPASYNIDLAKVKKLLKASKVDFTPEKAMAKLKIKPGALSPFGSLRGFGVVVDKALLKTKDVLVGAESFTESLRMKAMDLVAIEGTVVGTIGKKNRLKLQKKASPKKKPKKGRGPKKSAKKPSKKSVGKGVSKRTAARKPAGKAAPKRKKAAGKRA